MNNDAELKVVMIEDIIESMEDYQYYCVRCEEIFDYQYDDQYGCEQCGAAIGDNNIAGEI